jgi:hypothetical protein
VVGGSGSGEEQGSRAEYLLYRTPLRAISFTEFNRHIASMKDSSRFPVCIPSGGLFYDVVVIHAEEIFMPNPIKNKIYAEPRWAIFGVGIQPEMASSYMVSGG